MAAGHTRLIQVVRPANGGIRSQAAASQLQPLLTRLTRPVRPANGGIRQLTDASLRLLITLQFRLIRPMSVIAATMSAVQVRLPPVALLIAAAARPTRPTQPLNIRLTRQQSILRLRLILRRRNLLLRLLRRPAEICIITMRRFTASV